MHQFYFAGDNQEMVHLSWGIHFDLIIWMCSALFNNSVLDVNKEKGNKHLLSVYYIELLCMYYFQ